MLEKYNTLYDQVVADFKDIDIDFLKERISDKELVTCKIAKICNNEGKPIIEITRESEEYVKEAEPSIEYDYCAIGHIPFGLNEKFLENGLGRQRYDLDKIDEKNPEFYYLHCGLSSSENQLSTISKITKDFYKDKEIKIQSQSQQGSDLIPRPLAK